MERCGNCQAPVVFAPGTDALACEHCGTKRPIERKLPPGKAPLASADAAQPILAAEQRVASCTNCGAQTDLAGTVAATRCAFCNSAIEPKVETNVPAPARAVVPFEVAPAAATAAYRNWLKSLWFRPSDLSKLARLDSLRGVYTPAWRYDVHASSDWTAEAGYHRYRTVEVEENGRRVTKQERYTEWRPANGHREDDHVDALGTASKTVTSGELAALSPYVFTNVARFDRAFLAGFDAERLARRASEAWPEVEQEIQKEQERRCAYDVQGDEHRFLRVDTGLSALQAADALLPVYVAAFEYRAKLFRVLVNGQSGKVSGDAPWSVPKIAATVVVVVAAVAGLVWWMNQP